MCEKKSCSFRAYVKDQDWGYYTETEGDCNKCKGRCDQDPNCGAVECGESLGYCSWWKTEKCSREEARGRVYTCRKGKYLMV